MITYINSPGVEEFMYVTPNAPNAPSAREVKIAFSDHRWQQLLMKVDNLNPNIWRICIRLCNRNYCPQFHEYKFIVDGVWYHDPLLTTTNDGFGGKNNLFFCGCKK